MLHIDILDFYAGGVYILIVLLTVNRFVVFRPIITDVIIGVRAEGARGAAAPPEILGNSDSLGNKRKNLGKASF